MQKLEAAHNVEIRTNCKVTAISREKITTEDGISFEYGHLVGADGSFSIVRKFLEIKTEKNAIAIQYIIPTDKYDKLEFFFDSRLFQVWYAWIFPHKGYASIGCMCDPRYLSSKRLQQNFNKWLQKNNIDISQGKFEGYSINYDYRGYRFGNIFLAGDAAGLATGWTGEGIYQALISGEEIAKVILDNKYEAPAIQACLKAKELQEKAMNILIKAGPLRNIFFAALIPATKNKKLANWIIKRF